SRASCSSMASPAPPGPPRTRPVSWASASTSAASWSSVQSPNPAARTATAAVSSAERDEAPPAASTARATVWTAARSIAEERVVEGVGPEVAAAGGALDDGAGLAARQHGHAEQGEAAASAEPLIVAVASAVRAEELAVAQGRPGGTGAQDARKPGCTAVVSPS